MLLITTNTLHQTANTATPCSPLNLKATSEGLQVHYVHHVLTSAGQSENKLPFVGVGILLLVPLGPLSEAVHAAAFWFLESQLWGDGNPCSIPISVTNLREWNFPEQNFSEKLPSYHFGDGCSAINVRTFCICALYALYVPVQKVGRRQQQKQNRAPCRSCHIADYPLACLYTIRYRFLFREQ